MHRGPLYRTWVLVLLCMALCTFAFCTTTVPGTELTNNPGAGEFAGWHLTLNGSTERVLTLDEIRALQSVTGHGYAVSTVGIRYGPWVCRGVDLRDLVALVGGTEPGDQLWISAPDGYLWVFDHDQLEGNGFVTFDANLREIPAPPLRVILVYELNGTPLTYDDGGPCRIGIVSDIPGVVTEGSAWVKWVDRIEVRRT